MPNKDLQFSINLDSPISVYMQIENQVQFGIASGKYKPGDTLPSVRDMSEVLGINPNTVTKAYRDLEMLELVHTRRGVGVTVAEKAPKKCRDKMRAMVEDHLRDAVAECMATGFTPAEVRKMVTDTIDSGVLPYMVSSK